MPSLVDHNSTKTYIQSILAIQSIQLHCTYTMFIQCYLYFRYVSAHLSSWWAIRWCVQPTTTNCDISFSSNIPHGLDVWIIYTWHAESRRKRSTEKYVCICMDNVPIIFVKWNWYKCNCVDTKEDKLSRVMCCECVVGYCSKVITVAWPDDLLAYNWSFCPWSVSSTEGCKNNDWHLCDDILIICEYWT